jgi:fructan beta-fructosidase
MGSTQKPLSVRRSEQRPAYHFNPAAHWMNDPNGLVFHQGVYHLFFQYHPYSTVWGPMHWGHASSQDLVHWQEHSLALAPDEHGLIFSGSAVWDAENTSGLGTAEQPPLVALFTYHRLRGPQEAPDSPCETQGLAYSLDAGATWVKHPLPVLNNPGLKDFRDPKVFWHEQSHRWIMALACTNRVSFYSSLNLREWTWLSDFSQNAGEGVWECPDLFELPTGDGDARWVLLVSVTLGGPQGGSATQYFVGQFNGQDFLSEHHDTRWLDWGTDHYAGVTWSNTGTRKLLIGWMSNWRYANKTPTEGWRGSMTLPRELTLQRVEQRLMLCCPPAAEVESAFCEPISNLKVGLEQGLVSSSGRFKLQLKGPANAPWSLQLGNPANGTWQLSFDDQRQLFVLDRSGARAQDFQTELSDVFVVPRLGKAPDIDVNLYVDTHSIEVFAENGLLSMTHLVFPDAPWDRLNLEGAEILSAKIATVCVNGTR